MLFRSLAPPEWRADAGLDLDYHVRSVALPEPASVRDLLDLAATLCATPFDRSRPLWEFTVISGLAGGHAALLQKLHHTITDGVGGLKLSLSIVDRARNPRGVPEVQRIIGDQADLAREHGVHGFCYYHYWFGGKRLLEQPFNVVLKSRKPGFPFCLCWANEPWSRRWNGRPEEVLQAQNYSPEDDRQHIRWKRFYNVNFPPNRRENAGADGLFDASRWEPRASGLLGPVTLRGGR